MTPTAKDPSTGRVPRTDDDLLAAVRAQEPHAFQELRDRHRPTALGVALLHTPDGHDAELLADTAFDQVLADVEKDDGPDAFLRARLVAVVGRAGARSPHAVEVLAGAYLGLPSVWQAVLWHLDVEGLELSQAAAVLGLAPEDAGALHLEARAGLRAAYRRAELDAPVTPACVEHAGRLGALVGGELPAEQAGPLQDHLDECPRCAAEHLSSRDADEGLRSWLVPGLAGVSPWAAQAAKVEDLVRIAGHVSAVPVPAVPAREAARRVLAAGDLSRRGRRVVLGAGALASAAVLAGVALTGTAAPGGGSTRAAELGAGTVSGAEASDVPPSSPQGSFPADPEAGPVAGAAGAAQDRGAGRTLSLPAAEPSSGPLTESAAAQRRTDGRVASVVAPARAATGARPSADVAADRTPGRPGAPVRERAGTPLRADGGAADRGSGTVRTASAPGDGDGRGSSSPSSAGARSSAPRPGSPAPSPVASVPGVQLVAAAAPASVPPSRGGTTPAPSPVASVAGSPAPSPVASVPGVQVTAPAMPAPVAPVPAVTAPVEPAPVAPVPAVTAPVDPAPGAAVPPSGDPAPSPVVPVPDAETAAPLPAAPAAVAPGVLVPATAPQGSGEPVPSVPQDVAGVLGTAAPAPGGAPAAED